MRSLALAAVTWCALRSRRPPPHKLSVGTVAGVVKDSAGAPIPGATIQITARGAAPLTRVSDASGAFAFERVPDAEYDLTAPSPVSSDSLRAISVRAGKTTRFDIVLQPGGVDRDRHGDG